MYCDGPLLWVQYERPMEAWCVLPATLPPGQIAPRLQLARRQTLTGLHPLEQGGLGVTNGPPDLGVGRAIAAHAGFRQPREADFKKLGRFLWRKKDDGRRGRSLRQAAGERRLRRHFGSFLWQLRAEAPRPGPPGLPAKWNNFSNW